MDNNSELNNNVTPENVTNNENVTQELPIVNNPTEASTTGTDSTNTEPLTPSVSVDGPIEIEEKTVDPSFVDRTANPGVIGNIGPVKEEDPNKVVNEDLKKVEINYTPPSKGKMVSLILFFIFLIAFIIFLPQITTMVNELKAGGQEAKEVKITTGRLICTYKTNTTNLDKEYKLTFGFTDNKLEKLEYNSTTKGDPTSDEETLDNLADKCKLLKQFTSSIEGVNVTCDYSEGKLFEKQSFVYADLDEEKLTAAYTEAGGTSPQYVNGQDMDYIEKNMNASGYSCERQY